MSHTSHLAGGSHNCELVKAGKKGTIHISAKAMNITWAEDARFWKWIQLSKNDLPKAFSEDDMRCFDVAAELIQVNWLEARGSVDLAAHQPRLGGCRCYEIVYHIRFKVDAFGWNRDPVTFELVTPEGQGQKKSVMLEQYRRSSTNKWHEIHGGEISTTGKVEFTMYQVESHGWKGGMILGGVSLRPK